MGNIVKIGKYWNGVYDAFHSTPKRTRMSVWNEKPTPFFTSLMDFLKHENVKTIMDAGCGDGRNIKPYLEAGFHVIGVDASSSALAICRKYFGNNPNLKLLQGDITTVELSRGLDAVMCDHVLTHIKNVDGALANFYRLLRKGGYGLIEFTSPFDSTYSIGKKLSDREFLQKGVYLRYDDVPGVYRMMKPFKILCFTSEHSTDPSHGSGYIREKRHRHHSYFVLAKKE